VIDVNELAARVCNKAAVLSNTRKLTRPEMHALVAAAIGIAIAETLREVEGALELEPARITKRLLAVINGEAKRIAGVVREKRIRKQHG
jgi:hypothetical protein